MCRVLRVARSGWYIWNQRRVKPNSRQQFRLSCDSVVHDAFHRAKQRYGAPRLTDELHDVQGYRFNVNRSGPVTLRTYARMKAGCIWQSSSSCGCVPLSAGQCRHG
jgi:putative transposase